jgi:ribosomal protein L22
LSGLKWPGSQKPSATNTPLAKELTRRERETKLATRLSSRTQGSSIFDEEIKGSRDQHKAGSQLTPGTTEAAEAEKPMLYSKMKEHMEMALDPDPRWRVRYQKKKVMQFLRSNRQLTREERIKQSEKELTDTSEVLPTSTKKLVMLSHQIVGKTVDEAITQMRYSKKKMGREVKFQLEEARATAIAERGMGLGAQNGELLAKPRKIRTKDGKTIEVQDPTQLYVDQAWVTKGPYRGARVQYHSRGRMSMMWRPTTRE